MEGVETVDSISVDRLITDKPCDVLNGPVYFGNILFGNADDLTLPSSLCQR